MTVTINLNDRSPYPFGAPPGPGGSDGEDGDNGREVELRKGDTHVQWRYAGETEWIDLVSLSDLTGGEGPAGPNIELQVDSGNIQWRVAGGESPWANLIPVADLVGEEGPPGPSLQLQKSDTHIQWRVADTGDWADLVPLVDLEGEQGPAGDMDASVYDTDGDGKVDAADAADTVPWDGVQNKPNFGNLATKNTVDNSDWSGDHLSVENGGTGASTPAAARAAFGIGSMGQVNVTISTSNPSGGANNDFHAKVT